MSATTAPAPARSDSSHWRRRRIGRSIAMQTVAVLVGAIIIVPVVFGVLGGFKTNGQLVTNPWTLPDPWVWTNYGEVLGSSQFWRFLLNSTVIGLASTVGTVGVAALAGFIFARYAFRGREALFTVFVIGLMFPFAVAILPLFVLLRTFELLDNPLGVILPQVAFGLPLTIIILRGFFRTIPAEIEESATLDGCTPFGFFWRILLPMARPALATVSVLAIVTSWNNFLLPLVVMNSPEQWTLPLGVQQFQTQYANDYARILAYVVIAMVPALIFYLLAERQLISGLTGGAVKE